MQIQPILAALRKHRLATLLIALEIALACAVLCNACFLIVSRVQQTHVHSGVDEKALAVLKLTGYDPANSADLNARVLSGVAKIPGVQSVDVINAVPFGDHAGTAGISTDAEGKRQAGVIDFFVGGPGSFKALGLHLVAGSAPQASDFQPIDTYFPKDATVWVTRALADHLWPGADPLGKEFWSGKLHFRVAGVLAHLARPYGGEGGPARSNGRPMCRHSPARNLPASTCCVPIPPSCHACCVMHAPPWPPSRPTPWWTARPARPSAHCARTISGRIA